MASVVFSRDMRTGVYVRSKKRMRIFRIAWQGMAKVFSFRGRIIAPYCVAVRMDILARDTNLCVISTSRRFSSDGRAIVS